MLRYKILPRNTRRIFKDNQVCDAELWIYSSLDFLVKKADDVAVNWEMVL